MSGFTKGVARVEEGTLLVWGESTLMDDGTPDHLGIPIAEALPTGNRRWGRQMRDGEPEDNAELIALAFTTASALSAAGYDAMKAMEALPEILADFLICVESRSGQEVEDASRRMKAHAATLRTDTPAVAQEAAGPRHFHVAQDGTGQCGKCGHDLRHSVHLRDGETPPNLAVEIATLRRQVDALAEACEAWLAIIGDSRGIDGLHRNGDVALWSEFGTEISATESALTAAGRR